MSDTQAGGGILFEGVSSKLHATLRKGYVDTLAKLPMKPTVRGTLADGFADGLNSMLRALVDMKIVAILPDPTDAKKA